MNTTQVCNQTNTQQMERMYCSELPWLSNSIKQCSTITDRGICSKIHFLSFIWSKTRFSH